MLICVIGRLHIEIGITDLDGNVLAVDSLRWGFNRGPAATLRKAIQISDALISSAQITAPIWMTVIGMASAVDVATGSPVSADSMPEWDGYDVRGVFARHYGAPTWVDKETNLLAANAMSEVEGAADSAGMIYLKVGTGVDAAFAFGGRIHRGAIGAAGEIGHTQVDTPRALTCFCGRTSCLESVCAGWAVVRDVKAALDLGETSVLRPIAGVRRLTPADVADASREFDPLAIRTVGEAAVHAGRAVAQLANALNPRLIVAGGSIGGCEAFQTPFARTIEENALPAIGRGLRIGHVANLPHEAVRGGASLAGEQLFEASFHEWCGRGSPVSKAKPDNASALT